MRLASKPIRNVLTGSGQSDESLQLGIANLPIRNVLILALANQISPYSWDQRISKHFTGSSKVIVLNYFSSMFFDWRHRLIIYPDRQSISSLLENWTFCCPVLGSRQCTSAYTETGDPARRPGIPQPWHWHSTVRQGSVRFNLKEALPLSLFPSRCIYSLIGVLCYIYGQCFYKTFSHGSANSKEKNIHLQNIKSQTIYRTKPGLIYCSEPSIVILRAWLGKYICIVK